MRLKPIAIALLALAWAAGPAAAQATRTDAAQAETGATGAPFTPAQRAEIVAIVRQALKKDPSLLRDAILALQADENAHQESAAKSAIAAHKDALLRDPADPVAGNANGSVTIVEFYDARCPYCRRMLPVIETMLKKDPGVRLVLKDLPILGPQSKLAARALLAAQKQGAYLTLQKALMLGTTDITEDTIKTQADKLGLDWPRLQRDMADPAIKKQIDGNLALARTLGIDGTPAYVIGDELIPGAIDLAGLQNTIKLARAK